MSPVCMGTKLNCYVHFNTKLGYTQVEVDIHLEQV